MVNSSNPPRKHHYLPEFYLRQWAGEDGKLERYTREHGDAVHVRRVAPAAAGWAPNLYRIPGETDPWAAARIETDFFGPLDNGAADALAEMIATGAAPQTSEGRTYWASFMLSLLHRTPEHLSATLDKVRELNANLMPEAEARYAELRGPADPPTFAEWEQQWASDAVERSGLRAFMNAIASPRTGPLIINMHWAVIDLSASDYRLLSADNPVILVPFKLPNAQLAMPISPTKLFLASPHENLVVNMQRTPPKLIARQSNLLMVERATSFVISDNLTQAVFVRRYFGTCKIGSLATGLSQPERRGGRSLKAWN